ncbi:MAG: tyrosine-type recombinase/integrase [Planctomycetota bacterium]|jgi:site-specific recombinase XerD
MNKEIEQFKKYLQCKFQESSTAKHYVSDLNIFHRFAGDITAKEITTKLISQFIQEQSRLGKSATTINRRVSSISSFVEFLIEETGDDNWVSPVRPKIHKVKAGYRLPRDINDEAVSQLFKVIEDVRDRAMFSLMINCGMRVGEVVKLNVSDVENLEESILTRLTIHGKGNKERTAWLTVETMVRVTQWLEERPENEEEALFINRRDGGRLSTAGASYALKQYCEKSGVYVTCHQFRHTFARRMVENGMLVDSLAKLLGHNSIQTTMRYIDGANPTVRADFLKAMEQLKFVLPLEETKQADTRSFPACQPEERPDPMVLADELGRLSAGLPEQIAREIRLYVIRQSSRWATHRVEENFTYLYRTLCRITRWLVKERNWQQLEQLKRNDLAAFVNYKLEQGIKPQSIAATLTKFHSFWRDLLAQELVTNGTILQVKAPSFTKNNLPKFLTRTEFQRLEQTVLTMSKADTTTDRLNLALFYLFAHGGLRLSEALNLRLEDCDLSGKRLSIRAGKGNKDRVIPMSLKLVSVLQDYLVVREQAPTNHLLISKKGVAVTKYIVEGLLARFGQEAEIKPLRSHRLRHTLATLLINQGMSLASLQHFLGHENLDTTMVYAKVYDETVQKQFASAMTEIEGIVVKDWPKDNDDLSVVDVEQELNLV